MRGLVSISIISVALLTQSCIARNPQIRVEGLEVPREQIAQVEHLTVKAFSFLRQTFREQLQRTPSVQLFTSYGALADALQKHPRFKLRPRHEVETFAQRISGYAVLDETILINLGNVSPDDEENMLGLLTHELTHVYQYQFVGKKRAPVPMWIAEGQALLMSALNREAQRSGRYNWFKDHYLGVLKREIEAGNALPTLEELEPIVDYHSSGSYSPQVVQGIAFLAVDFLYQSSGLAPLEHFMTLFRASHNHDDNFELAFGRSLEQFHENWETHLARLLKRK